MDHCIDGLCNIKYLLSPPNFDPSSPNKLDVVVTSLFRMKKGYKNFSKYINGLRNSITQYREACPNLYFVLYIDDTIYKDTELYQSIYNMDNGKLFILRFECLIGLADDGVGHVDLFGTMVRFLPFFDYESNFTRNVINIDADGTRDDTEKVIENYKIFTKISSLYHFDTNPFYELLADWHGHYEYSVIAARHMCKYKFPLHLLTDYIKCSKERNCPNVPDLQSMLDYNKYAVYPYGIDEFFLNWVLIPYMKDNNITYSINVRYAITAPLYIVSYRHSFEPGTDRDLTINQGLKEILQIPASTRMQTNMLISKFDRLFSEYLYGEATSLSQEAYEAARRYYEFINKLDEDKNYTIFPESTLKKIMTHNDYIADRIIIIRYPHHSRYFVHKNYVHCRRCRK